MSKAVETTLGKLCDITSSKRIFYHEYVENGVPFFRSKEIIELAKRKKITTELHITHEKYNAIKSKSGAPQKDDILLTSVGTLGVPYLVPGTFEFYFKDGNLTWFRNWSNNVYPKFIYWWLKSPIGYQSLLDISIGSTQPALTIDGLKGIKIHLPSIQDQMSIAEIFDSLEDKINLLNRNNKTLEELAETVFRKWFIVDADERWMQTTLYDIIELVGGGTPKTDKELYWDGNINWISAKDISANQKGFIVKTEKRITESGLSHSSAKMLDKYSTVISARGTVGKYCLLSEPMTFSQSNYGIKPKQGETYFFTYLVVAHCVEELKASAYGTVFDTITTKTFKDIKIKVPSNQEIIRFEHIVCPYFEKIEANTKQIIQLEELRSTLLCRLIDESITFKTSRDDLVCS